jgi:hypothetical protein
MKFDVKREKRHFSAAVPVKDRIVTAVNSRILSLMEPTRRY